MSGVVRTGQLHYRISNHRGRRTGMLCVDGDHWPRVRRTRRSKRGRTVGTVLYVNLYDSDVRWLVRHVHVYRRLDDSCIAVGEIVPLPGSGTGNPAQFFVTVFGGDMRALLVRCKDSEIAAGFMAQSAASLICAILAMICCALTGLFFGSAPVASELP